MTLIYFFQNSKNGLNNHKGLENINSTAEENIRRRNDAVVLGFSFLFFFFLYFFYIKTEQVFLGFLFFFYIFFLYKDRTGILLSFLSL